MSDLLRSAFNYFTQASPTATVSGCKTDHPLVGTAVEVGGLRLKIRSLLAEGGYALVFSAQDAQGNWFALKRQLAADRDAANAVIREIRFLRELTGHPAIIRYVQAAHLGPQESGHGRAEFLMLTELCSGGSVVEFLQKKDFTPTQVMKIFYAACSAVRHMHTRNPPITHRDIKVENLLFDSCGFVKLCDFGSATTETFQPDDLWSALQRTQLEEELARHTTPMYRAPELLDLYSNFPIGPPQDIWALGCILFYLCYRKHPFEDSAKLRIINAKYVLPEVETGYNMFHPLIQTTLQVDPRQRPLASDLCERAGALAAAMGVDLTKPVEGLDLPQLAPTASVNATAGQLQRELASHTTDVSKNTQSPRLPSTATHRADHMHEQTAQQQASAMLGAIKGQGMTWFKNIKDRTTAVAQTVQSTYGGRGPDVTFVTSRLVIAPLAEGIPEALASQAEDAMRLSILEQARGQFAIYNLSQRRLRCDYSNRSSETPMPPLGSGITPTLNMLMGVCRNMALFLRQKPTNFIVVTGPEAQCVLMASVMLLYSGLVEKPSSAIELVCAKRNIPILPPSYHRQLDILRTIVSTDRENLRAMVHNRRVLLDSILISPTPTFNRARTGCRPIVEIYSAGNKLWTTGKDYEELQSFELPESSTVDLNLGHVPVADDVQVVVYHARWTKMQNRMQQHLMFSASFHANFIDPHTHMLEMGRADLDISHDDDGKFGEPFRIGIRVHIEDVDRGFNTNDPPIFLSYDPSTVSRMALLSDPEEYDAVLRQLGATKQSAPSRPARPPRPQHSPQVLRAQHKEDTADRLLSSEESRPPLQGDSFFATLQWNDAASASAGVTCAPSLSPNLPEVQPDSSLHEQKGQPHVPQQLAQKQQEHELLTCSQPQAPSAPVLRLTGMDKAETYERMYGIRVSGTNETPDEESEKYKFDCEKTSKQPIADDQTAQLAADIDLLGLGDVNTFSSASDAVRNSTQLSFDAFAHFENNATTNAQLFGHKSASSAAFYNNQQRVGNAEVDDLLEWSSSTTNSVMHDRIAGLSVHSSGMQRNVSAPSFATEPSNVTTAPVFDPFAEFLASTSSEQVSKSNQGSKTNLFSGSGVNSGRATPSQQRPNYSRAHFDAINSIGGLKPKLTENAFDDLLTSQGFSSSSRNAKTMDQMKRADEAKTMDPVAIKIRDWTNGKERNIRALLGSLNDVLWEGADKWNQPSMGDLLTASQVKRFYRKACLVIHPDKQIGTENEALARAIFTELNDAWTAFENAGSPSL